jgi:hypothetical protein
MTEAFPLEYRPNVPASYIFCGEDRTVRPEVGEDEGRGDILRNAGCRAIRSGYVACACGG